MKSYEVYVQEKFYKIMTGDNIQSILSQVSQDIEQNLVPEFDANIAQNIRVVPSSTEVNS